MNILVTGGSGFIGSNLLQYWKNKKHRILTIVRKNERMPSWVEVRVMDLCSLSEFDIKELRKLLHDIDIVVHLAGIAHISDKSKKRSFQKCNTDATVLLANLSASSNVKRFIYISSIGVHGAENLKPFSENDTINPLNDYALSKFNSETGLQNIANTTNMEVIVIRPPLVYGPNAPGNVGRLSRWARRPFPLPLGSIQNIKSFVALDNLIDFINHCAELFQLPRGRYEVFLISDGDDVSTTQFLKKLLSAYGKKNVLMPFPVAPMEFFVCLLGKEKLSTQLFKNLQINSNKARTLLDWSPVVTMDQQIQKMAEFDKGKSER